MKTKKQPLGIVLNVVVLAILGMLSILGAVIVVMFSTLQTFLVAVPFASYFSAIAIILFIFALTYFALAWGLWKHKAWAWWTLTVFGAVGILSDLFIFLTTGTISITGMVFSVILFMGLLHHKTIKAIEPDIEWKGWGK